MKGDRKVFVVWLHRGSPGTINDSLDLHLLNLMCSGDIRFIDESAKPIQVLRPCAARVTQYSSCPSAHGVNQGGEKDDLRSS